MALGLLIVLWDSP